MFKTINVTQEDIDKATSSCVVNGKLSDDCLICHECVIAVALSREFDKAVSVGYEHFYFDGINKRVGRLPAMATNYIKMFDSGKKVLPATFKIELFDNV